LRGARAVRRSRGGSPRLVAPRRRGAGAASGDRGRRPRDRVRRWAGRSYCSLVPSRTTTTRRSTRITADQGTTSGARIRADDRAAPIPSRSSRPYRPTTRPVTRMTTSASRVGRARGRARLRTRFEPVPPSSAEIPRGPWPRHTNAPVRRAFLPHRIHAATLVRSRARSSGDRALPCGGRGRMFESCRAHSCPEKSRRFAALDFSGLRLR
jgi:hypothetical protein